MCRTMGKTNNNNTPMMTSPQSILSSSSKTTSVLDVHSLGDATVTTAASSSSSVTFGTASSVSINLDCTRIYLIDSIPEMLSKEELKEIWYSPEECQYMKEQEQFGDEADDDEVVHDGELCDSVRVEKAAARRLTSLVKKKENSNSRKKNRTTRKKKISFASPIATSSSTSPSPSTPRSMLSCSSLISHIPTTGTGSNINSVCSQRHRRRSVRSLNRRRAWHAVLDEQRRQQDVGMDDAELLATIYRGYNIASAQTARKLAQRAAMTARRIHADSPERSSTSSTNTVPPPTASNVAPAVTRSVVAHTSLTQQKQRQVPRQPQRSVAPSVGDDTTTTRTRTMVTPKQSPAPSSSSSSSLQKEGTMQTSHQDQKKEIKKNIVTPWRLSQFYRTFWISKSTQQETPCYSY